MSVIVEALDPKTNQKVVSISLVIPCLIALSEQSSFFKEVLRLHNERSATKTTPGVFQIAVPDPSLSFEILIQYLINHDSIGLADSIEKVSRKGDIHKGIVISKLLENSVYLGLNQASGLWDALAWYYHLGLADKNKLHYSTCPTTLIARVVILMKGGDEGIRVIRNWARDNDTQIVRAMYEIELTLDSYKQKRYERISDAPSMRDMDKNRGYIARQFNKDTKTVQMIMEKVTQTFGQHKTVSATV